MKILVALLFAAGLVAAASARPLVLQEQERVANPDASFPDFGTSIAIDGDEALVVLHRYNPPGPDDCCGEGDSENLVVWLFRRTDGVWAADHAISKIDHPEFYIWGGGVAMQGDIAALAVNPLTIYEKRNGEWVPSAIVDVLRDDPGTEVEVSGNRVIFGGSSSAFMGTVFERNPTTGAWSQTRLPGDGRGGDFENSGGPVGIDGNRAVVLSPSSDDPDQPDLVNPAVAVYEFGALGWQPDGNPIRSSPTLWPLGDVTAVRGNDVFVSGTNMTGTHVFRPAPASSMFDWTDQEKLQPLDSFMGGGTTSMIRKNALFVMQSGWSADRQARVINVFASDSAGHYRQVATLAASGGESLGSFAISGRRVLANCGDQLCYFELPASLTPPARIQDTFPRSTPVGWTLSAGSQFSIAKRGASYVLRQANTTGTATQAAVRDASDWSNQSIQADVRATGFDGADRWIGLATHWKDASNYYYVSLRSSGYVALRKKVKGAVRQLAAAPMHVGLNHTYKLRLESIGTRQRVYVDGAPMLDVDDSALSSGRAALLTYHAAGEFDNVIISPTPTVSMFAFDLPRDPADVGPDFFAESGPGLWLATRNHGHVSRLSQESVAGDARTVTGVATDDQSIDARVRGTTFAGTGDGERWFGVLGRYVDAQNYYFLSLRSGNTVSLHKVVNGLSTELASAPMVVTLGRWYELRLEVVGDRLRGYVNGTDVLEATDPTFTSGQTGFVTYRAAADFDNYRAIQP